MGSALRIGGFPNLRTMAVNVGPVVHDPYDFQDMPYMLEEAKDRGIELAVKRTPPEWMLRERR